MEEGRLFEAFFYVEPHRDSSTDSFKQTRVVYNIPTDVSAIPKEFRDVSQFCFPDLEIIKLERAERAKIDHYTFTMTDKDGGRMYGICLRGLDGGEGRRFDVRRRTRKCFCIISRNPFFLFFRAVLTQAYGLSLLRPGGEKEFIDELYQYPMPSPGESVTIQCSLRNKMFRAVQFVTPLHAGLFYRETPIVPLVKALGAEQFLLVLSAALCERRLIFVAEDVGTLSMAVNAATAMLHPFQWPHMFIPLLPFKLLSYAAAPVPYMIGIRKYMLPRLFKEAIDDVVIIDLDKRECTVHGNCVVKDFVGSAGTVMKQATESLSRMTAGMSKLLSSGAGSSKGPAAGGDDRDLVACLLTDLRGGMAKMPKPTTSQDLFRMGKTALDDSIERWSFEFEKTVRDSLLLFYTFLFADMEDSMTIKSSGGVQKASLDIRLFKNRRTQLGITKDLNDFLTEFLGTQLFESFADERCDKFLISMTGSASKQRIVAGKPVNSARVVRDDDEFNWVSEYIRSRHKSATCTVLMDAIAAFHTTMKAASAQTAPPSDTSPIAGTAGIELEGNVNSASGFHPLTLQFTSNSENARVDPMVIMEKIASDACSSNYFASVMRTVWLRLEDCRGSNYKHGVKGLGVLQTLLLTGPEAVMGDVLDHIPLLQQLTRYRSNVDIRARASEILSLVLDHERAEAQRRWWSLKRCGAFPYTLVTRRLLARQVKQIHDVMKENGGLPYHPQNLSQFPDFKGIHMMFKPNRSDTSQSFQASPPSKSSSIFPDTNMSVGFDALSLDPFSGTNLIDPFSASGDPAFSSNAFADADPFVSGPADLFATAAAAKQPTFANPFANVERTVVSESQVADPFSSVSVDPFGTVAVDPFGSSSGAKHMPAPSSEHQSNSYGDPFASNTSLSTGVQASRKKDHQHSVPSSSHIAPTDPFGSSLDPFAIPALNNSDIISDPFTSHTVDPFAVAPVTAVPVSKSMTMATAVPRSAPAAVNDPFGNIGGDPFSAATRGPVNTNAASGKSAADPFATNPGDPFAGSASNGSQTIKKTAAPVLDPFDLGCVDPFAPVTVPKAGGTSRSTDPFAAPAYDPFGSGNNSIHPKTTADPFATNLIDPFSSSSVDPFAMPSNPVGNRASDPFATSSDPFGSTSTPQSKNPTTKPLHQQYAVRSMKAPQADPFAGL